MSKGNLVDPLGKRFCLLKGSTPNLNLFGGPVVNASFFERRCVENHHVKFSPKAKEIPKFKGQEFNALGCCHVL